MNRLGQMLMDEGMEKGIEKGIEQGIEKGIEKGIELNQITQLAMNSPYPPASTSLLLLAFMPACIRE